MKRALIFITCFILGISSIHAFDTSDILKGKLPPNRKTGPIFLKYLQDGAIEEKEKPNVKSAKFWFKTFDSKNERYAIEGKEIFLKNGVDMVRDVEWVLIGSEKSFSIQLVSMRTYTLKSDGWGHVDYGQKKNMNAICKATIGEIESLAKNITDSDYNEVIKKIESGRIFTNEVIVTDYENSFSSDDFLVAYWKITGKKLKRSDYLNFLIACRHDVYIEFHDDEFELENEIDKIKAEIDNKIATLDLSKKYQVSERMKFGKYDFDNNGYSVNLEEGTFFVMEQDFSASAEKNSDAYRELVVKPVNYTEFNFMPIERKTAQNILEKRKDSVNGNVNRSISTLITFHFLTADSKEYKEFSKYWDGRSERLASKKIVENPIPLVIVIDSMDAFSAFDTKNGLDIDYLSEIINK